MRIREKRVFRIFRNGNENGTPVSVYPPSFVICASVVHLCFICVHLWFLLLLRVEAGALAFHFLEELVEIVGLAVGGEGDALALEEPVGVTDVIAGERARLPFEVLARPVEGPLGDATPGGGGHHVRAKTGAVLEKLAEKLTDRKST